MAATIKVDFNAGDNIESAFTEAIRLAKILNVVIEFKFNDVTCLAFKNGNALHGVEQYRKVLSYKKQYKLATT